MVSEGFVYNLQPDYDKLQLVGTKNMVKAAIFLAQQDARGITGCVAHTVACIVDSMVTASVTKRGVGVATDIRAEKYRLRVRQKERGHGGEPIS